jgi:two-component system response regulator PilR (NtrC family)
LALAGSGTLEPIDLMLPVGEVDLLLEPEAPAAAAQASSAGYVLIDGVPSDLVAYLDRTEADAIRAALAKTRNNRTAAAQLLGITFRQLRYRMQRLGLK